MNKKGNIIFIGIMFIIIITLFGIFNIISYKIFTDVDDSILEDLDLNESKQVITDVSTRMPSVFDGVILIVFAGLWVLGLAAGYTKDEHPMLFGFMLLMCFAVLISGVFLSNAFEEFLEDDEFSGQSTNFPKTYWIVTHLLEVGIMMLSSTLLATMAKNRL